MLVVNNLTQPGGIRKVVLWPNRIVVTPREGEEIVYKRVESLAQVFQDTLKGASVSNDRLGRFGLKRNPSSKD